jgi:hypothetical protein
LVGGEGSKGQFEHDQFVAGRPAHLQIDPRGIAIVRMRDAAGRPWAGAVRIREWKNGRGQSDAEVCSPDEGDPIRRVRPGIPVGAIDREKQIHDRLQPTSDPTAEVLSKLTVNEKASPRGTWAGTLRETEGAGAMRGRARATGGGRKRPSRDNSAAPENRRRRGEVTLKILPKWRGFPMLDRNGEVQAHAERHGCARDPLQDTDFA